VAVAVKIAGVQEHRLVHRQLKSEAVIVATTISLQHDQDVTVAFAKGFAIRSVRFDHEIWFPVAVHVGLDYLGRRDEARRMGKLAA
jgi:hypothetical protein